ncbi:MAG: AI-2E family transporter [Alphaproteobacteria bacterium]|nr:AI-2E family transporter [Alphaproteobacteria bacterium]
MTEIKKANRNWVFWLTLFVLFCASVYILRSVLLPFVAGIIIGYLLDPLTSKFTKLGLNRTLATFLVLFLVIITLVPALIILFGVIDEQLGRFIAVVPQYIGSLIKKIEPLIIELQDRFPNLEPDKIKDYLRNNATNGLKLVGSVFRSVITGGFAFFNLLSLLLITPVVTFYMLRDWDKFIAKVDSLLPRSSKASIRQQAREIDRTLSGFIRGQFSVCVLLGTYYSLGLYFVGLELGVLVGFIAGLISFIPYVGSIVGFVVSLGIAFAQFDSLMPIIQVVIVFITGQFLEGNFLTPKLVGENVGLHPVWVMFALLAGGVLLGFLGLMIAVPVAAIIGVLIRHAIENYKKSSLYLDN